MLAGPFQSQILASLPGNAAPLGTTVYKSLIIVTLWRAKSDSRSQFLFNLPILRREPSNEAEKSTFAE